MRSTRPRLSLVLAAVALAAPLNGLCCRRARSIAAPVGAIHPVHVVQRIARGVARRPQRAGRGGQRLVSRGVGPREAGPDGLCPFVRTPDVRRLGARQGRRLRQLPRGRRRRQQRIDQHRPHELLPQRAGQRAGARAVPRVRSHGLSARRDVAGQSRWPTRRRQERAPAGRREPAVRAGVHHAQRDAVSCRSSLSLAHDRLHG